MKDMSNKLFGLVVIVIIAQMQIYAWNMGLNGVIFAFTSLCIGSIVGAVLGFKWGLKK